MGVRSQIIFNGVSSNTVNLYIEQGPDYVIPERDYTVTHVPGRNGDVVVDTGSYQNVERTYSVSFGHETQDKYVQYSAAVSAWLHSGSGYSDLQDTYEPLYFRRAYYKANTNFENILNKAGKGKLTFVCKPQRYLLTGETPVEITTSATMSNPTVFHSLPKIKVTGTWNDPIDDYTSNVITIVTNSGTYTIAFNPKVVLEKMYGQQSVYTAEFIIDCDIQDAYAKVNDVYKNLNGAVKLAYGYFGLAPGNNVISYTTTGTNSKLTVTPRWWTI